MLLHRPFRDHPELFPWGALAETFLLPWIMDDELLDEVHAAAANWENKDRMSSEKFILESLVVQQVAEKSRIGLVVPAGTVITYYLKFWQAREGGMAARAHVAWLQAGDATVRKNWMRAFRTRWSMDHGRLLSPDAGHEEEASILPKVRA